nr:hypothetical protein F6W77_19300 [Acinetobacter baumannii]
MKVCILFLLFGLAVADEFWQRAAPVVDNAVQDFLEGFGPTGSLRVALGVPNAVELDEPEGNVKKEIGERLREHLNNFLEKLRNKLEKGKEAAKDIKDKLVEIARILKDLKEDAGDKARELLEKLKQKHKDKLKELYEKLKDYIRKKKEGEDNEINEVAQASIPEFIEIIKEKISDSETISKIRDYIKNFVTTNPEVQELKEFLLKLREVDFRDLIRSIFEHHHRNSRGIKESWEKVKDWLKNVKDSIREKTKKLQEFLKEKWNIGIEKLKGHLDIVKALAKELIEHSKEIHGELAREALEFFLPYKEDLGSLWKQLYEVIKDRLTQP